ncbi:MAG: asparagine synthase [Pirellulaceae bacterium]|nr:MAG: asparagine synthase [Pirellulaceae bacterium]
MNDLRPIERVIDLIDPSTNILLNCSVTEAIEAVRGGDAAAVRSIKGQYAIVAREGRVVRMARSIGRPMRYFLAKREAGPCLIVAERIASIQETLQAEGLGDQFHPSYTRMVPAHHILELHLVGCPDPNPTLQRFFDPPRGTLPPDIDVIGRAYVGAVLNQLADWLDQIDAREPIGVLFSGGIDSGALVVLLHHLLLARGENPARLKAFTLAVGEEATDARQAREFLRALGMEMLLELIEVPPSHIRWQEAVRVIEDYKPLDVQAAAMTLAICREIRQRYPTWTWLVDGDGGDENLKDYPIEDNPELTIRSVLNNSMLYQEGWGVNAIKHSLVFSGGQSRGHVRTFAPAAQFGFRGFSPYSIPAVIEVAEAIPFVELTDWDHQRLYRLKGEVVRSGVEQLIGHRIPIYEKRRFQQGATSSDLFTRLFPSSELVYRREFDAAFSS